MFVQSSADPPCDGPTLEIAAEAERGPWGIEIGGPFSRGPGARCLPLERGATLILGSGEGADLRVEDPTVSARHARIEVTPRGPRIEDLGSKNGVYVGGARVESAWLTSNTTSLVVGRTAVTVRLLGEADDLLQDGEPISGLVGSSVPMRRLFADVRRVATLRASVLVQGESGSGKDVVAKSIHALSRRSGAYVPLNVGAIPESLADAELFGHCRGAFTGAIAARAGAFEQAHRGTLFLDEIAELSASIQVKLLRVVEERRVRPIGSTAAADVDVRVVSATWAPLEERVAAGEFREDLYHRLSTFVIRVPPLRARKSDIPALCRALLFRLRDELGPKEVEGPALGRLVAHSWPGNVRELGSVLYRAAAAAPGVGIDERHVDAAMVALSRRRPRALCAEEARALLAEHAGNVSAAARSAGVPRSTFRSWLERS